MKKTFVIFLGILLFSTFALGDSISNYSITQEVPLGHSVTATGIFTGDINSGILCSFYMLDDQNVLVHRATDQYTTGTGRFTMVGYPINEPDFSRDHNYYLVSECGTATATAIFGVAQFESIAEPAAKNFEYITKPSILSTIMIWATMILFIGFILGIILYFWKARKW